MSIKLGGSKSKSSTNTSGSFNRTDTPQVPDWLNMQTQDLSQQLSQLGGGDPYSLVAGADPLQQQAAGGAAALSPRSWVYDESADTIRDVTDAAAPQMQSASLLDGLDKYMSPYMEDVVDSALADFDHGAGQTRAQQALEMAGAGAFGGSGSAIARSQTEDALTRGRATTSATLRDEGFRVGAGLSDSDAARRQQAASTNAQLEADNLNRRLASAGQLVGQASQLGADERATSATQATIGDMMRAISGEQASAPADLLARQIAMLAGLNPQMFVGNQSSGTETGTSKTKGSQIGGSLSWEQKDMGELFKAMMGG